MGKRANFSQRKRDWGLGRALYWELMNAVARLGVHLHYVNIDGHLSAIMDETPPAVPTGYDTRYLGFEELRAYEGLVPDMDGAFLDSACARGDVCIANFHDDELVGFAFLSFTHARATPQLDVLVPEGFQYVYKGWTHQNHRRAGLAAARVHLRHQLLRANPAQRSISYVETHNYASLLRGYRHPRERLLRMGFCGWITVLGRQIPFNSRRAKWIGFELTPSGNHRRRQYVK